MLSDMMRRDCPALTVASSASQREAKAGHLLLFYGAAGHAERVAASGEHRASSAAVEGGKEAQLAFFKGELHVGAAQFDAIWAVDGVGGGGIDAQSVEGVVEL